MHARISQQRQTYVESLESVHVVRLLFSSAGADRTGVERVCVCVCVCVRSVCVEDETPASDNR